MPEPQLHTARVNDAELAYYEWGQLSVDQPSLFFVHATGFHGRVWDQVIEAFPQHHVISMEQRGHGRSSALPVTHWATFGQDQSSLVAHLGLQNLIGVGHSMGAHGLVDCAASSRAFTRLLLLDPTIAEPSAYANAEPPDLLGTLHPAAKRRARFSSPEVMVEQLRSKASFPLFAPRILRDYCHYGLTATNKGDFELLCKPEVEAQVYMTSRTNGAIYQAVRQLDIPIHIMRAKLPAADAAHDFSSSPTWPGLVHEFANATEVHLEKCSHFIPMQAPQLVIQQLQSEVVAWQPTPFGLGSEGDLKEVEDG